MNACELEWSLTSSIGETRFHFRHLQADLCADLKLGALLAHFRGRDFQSKIDLRAHPNRDTYFRLMDAHARWLKFDIGSTAKVIESESIAPSACSRAIDSKGNSQGVG